MTFSLPPPENVESWRRFFDRFSPSRRAFFRNWHPDVVASYQLGRSLPDRESIQWSGYQGGTATNPPAFPIQGITSGVAVKVERIESLWLRGSSFNNPDNGGWMALAFATDVWNPFQGATSTLFSVPQFRPSIADKNGRVGTPTTTLVNVVTPAANIPPPTSAWSSLTGLH